MYLAMILFHLSLLVLKAARKFCFLMEAISSQLLKDSKYSFITFGLEKVQELSFSKAITEESNLSYGMMMTQGSIVLQMMETCICGIFRITQQELMNM